MSRHRHSKSPTQPSLASAPDSQSCEEPIMSEEPILGIVHQCHTLNVREEPDKDADIVCSIQCLTEVMVDQDESTDEFYKIYTASGIEGYCMKKYISVHP